VRLSLRWYLGGGAAVVVLHALLPASLGRELLYQAIGVATLAVLVAGVHRNRPEQRAPWVLLACGVAAWVAGDAIWLVMESLLGIEPFPSVADVVYLAGYPLLAAGMHYLARARNPQSDRAAVLDALVAGTAVALVMWAAFIEPTWTAAEGAALERLVGVAYPVGDVVLLVQLVYLGGVGLGRSRSLRLLGGALAVTLLGDLLFQATLYSPVLDRNAAALDTLWLVGYLLFGAAALDRSMTRVAEAGPEMTVQAPAIGKLLFLGAVVMLLPLTLMTEVALGTDVHLVEVSVAALVVIGLVHLRMASMARHMGEQAERLARQADADVLTGLANRRRFCAAVDASLAAGGLDRVAGAAPVLLIVLDRFTEVNDTLGHRVGDELLCAAAGRMKECAGAEGLVGRLGGDSFGIQILGNGASPDTAMALASTVRERLTEPYELSDVTVSVDAIVGVAIGPGDGLSAADLLQRADVALSVARESADGVARYSGRMSAGGALTPHLMNELQAALDVGDVVVHYQPQVDLRTGRVLGVEALVRWQHPEHGLLPPVAFIPAAERTGLIRPLTSYVLDRALEQFALWRATGRELRVAVNLSVRNLLDRGFVADVREALARHGVAEASLDLEITETMAMVDPARSIEVLGSLEALGVVLSVDDYGTGYSSLAYLQRLPVQRLKIDKSFVIGMLDSDASAVIVRSTIDLARHLGMAVVAEGVEDDETLIALRDMRCDAAQGFGIGRPVPADEVLALIERIEARLPALLGLVVVSQQGR
jgi:diguanylate cyclase (GGDEF)-like protein